MSAACRLQEDGTIELYFYGELDEQADASVRAHLLRCIECAQALEELRVIRAALSARPDVSAPASGDWTSFMDRLDAAVGPSRVIPFAPDAVAVAPRLTRSPFAGLLATAALLAVVALSVFMVSRSGRGIVADETDVSQAEQVAAKPPAIEPEIEAALTAVGLRHLERSKLVVLGLTAKDSAPGDVQDWAYERELASSLLNDTRIYRQAAERRGLTRLAAVMRDLELVLLQTSMAEADDRAALPQIQRLIHKRGLVEKMDVVGTTGILP
jgi:hypothetical protein